MLPSFSKLDTSGGFAKKYSFCTLVTNFDEYLEMIQSAKLAGFDREDVEYFYIDNIGQNSEDGFSGINKAFKNVRGKYLIFCHQDIVFKFDNINKLDECIADLEAKDPNWAVVGNAGKKENGEIILRITDPHGDNSKLGNFPEEVVSLDENFLVLNRSLSLSTSFDLEGFHLYGLDICRNANYLGYKNYVIDFHLLHKSGGKIDHSFIKAQHAYSILEHTRKNRNFYTTTCTNFYVSSSSILNCIFKVKFLFKIYKRFKGLR